MMTPGGILEEKNYVSTATNHGFQVIGSQEKGKHAILKDIWTVGIRDMRQIRNKKAYR